MFGRVLGAFSLLAIFASPARAQLLNFTTFAGPMGGPGSVDGIGNAASFYRPGGVALDSAGNLYVADTENHTIRKITPAGAVTTLAGSSGLSGAADGVGAAARFDQPAGLATDRDGNVYVADRGRWTIRKITPTGLVTTLAGGGSGSGWGQDGIGTQATFSQPGGVATDGIGNVYVADTSDDLIRKITPAGVVTTLAGLGGYAGSADGVDAARFAAPTGVACDRAGNVYVADSLNNTIRKITPEGMVTTLAGLAGK